MPGSNAVYEFTLPKTPEFTKDDVHKLLRPRCKKYVFQLECGDTGYLHFQGRLSLFKKTTLSCAIKQFGNFGWHLSPTSGNALKGEAFYCMKEQTRVATDGGPWTEKDYVPPRVPSNRLLRSGILEHPYPWQQQLKACLSLESDRTVNLVVDPRGNNGKSLFVEWLEYLGLTVELPGFNSSEDFLQAAMNLPEQKMYLVDLPRAMPKKHLNGLFTAIEKLKNGYMCDKRYHFKWKRLLHSPSICVFTNKMPSVSYLSKDRWQVWTIKNKKLEVYDYGRDEEHSQALSDEESVMEDQGQEAEV